MKTCTFLVGLVLALDQSPQHAGEMYHHDLPVAQTGSMVCTVQDEPRSSRSNWKRPQATTRKYWRIAKTIRKYHARRFPMRAPSWPRAAALLQTRCLSAAEASSKSACGHSRRSVLLSLST